MTDWLLHTQLATSALALLVLIVREPVRTRFGSRVAYGLWLIPVARLFMPTLTQTVERPVPAAPPSLLVADEPLAMALDARGRRAVHRRSTSPAAGRPSSSPFGWAWLPCFSRAA